MKLSTDYVKWRQQWQQPPSVSHRERNVLRRRGVLGHVGERLVRPPRLHPRPRAAAAASDCHLIKS